MKKIKNILSQVNSNKTLKQEKMIDLGQKTSTSTKKEFIDAIDALFLKLELAYHYQFYKVFGSDERLKEGKKLWAVSLKKFSPNDILESVELVISSQSYLPTLTDIIKACEDIDNHEFPSVEEAYIEARKSYQPRKEYNWTHPIIYFVGKKIGWNVLNEKDTKQNFISFKKIFNAYKKQVIEGKNFKITKTKTEPTTKILDKNLLEKLRKKYKV